MTRKDKDERDWLAPALDALAEWRFDALEAGSGAGRRDATPAVQGEPVAYIRQEDFEFILADDKSEPYGTRQAPVFSRKDCRDPVPLYASPQPPAQAAEIEALRAEVERLRSMTAVTMGVGSGDGKLFVHGDYDSIKAVQALVLRAERLAEALRLIESATDRGFGIDYVRGVAQGVLLRDQEEGHE